jgi:hypothetical protein
MQLCGRRSQRRARLARERYNAIRSWIIVEAHPNYRPVEESAEAATSWRRTDQVKDATMQATDLDAVQQEKINGLSAISVCGSSLYGSGLGTGQMASGRYGRSLGGWSLASSQINVPIAILIGSDHSDDDESRLRRRGGGQATRTDGDANVNWLVKPFPWLFAWIFRHIQD